MSVGIAYYERFYQIMNKQDWLNNPETIQKAQKNMLILIAEPIYRSANPTFLIRKTSFIIVSILLFIFRKKLKNIIKAKEKLLNVEIFTMPLI